jgi:MFS family permease
MTEPPAHGPTERWVAFTHRSFALYWTSRLLAVFGTQILVVAVGWQIYDLTRDPLDLGIVGLVQFVPALLLVLVTGSVSDRFPRRVIMGVCMLIEGSCCLAILLLTLSGLTSPLPVFGLLAVFGVARAFFNPAAASLVANVVPVEILAGAIALNSSAWQLGTIVGPVAGGLLYGISPEAAYGTAFAMFVAASVLILAIPKPPQKTTSGRNTWKTVLAGFSYVYKEKIVFGAISLDLFAVLLGGAVALMPVYARDILELGPWGLGLLRAAPGIGALLTAVFLATHPVRDHAGLLMFVFVAGFGLFTVVFGLSTIVWLSILALALTGACDMVSVYIRETLIQVWTPDELRGRVNAVNMVFVGASNELGEFRAGVMAAMMGTVTAVVVGGAGTVAVAGLWARWFPELRRARHLDGTA